MRLLPHASVGLGTHEVEVHKYSTVFYVDQHFSAPTREIGTRTSPFRSLVEAVSNSDRKDAQNRTVILVAKGTYLVGGLQLRTGVDLYGGFDATHWTRNVRRYHTILKGEGESALLIGADDTVVDGFTKQHPIFTMSISGLRWCLTFQTALLIIDNIRT